MIPDASRDARWQVHKMGCPDPTYTGLDFGPNQSLDIKCGACGARRTYWTQEDGYTREVLDTLTGDVTSLRTAGRYTGSVVGRESRP